VIEVFADVCCPFTHVGLRRFVQRRAAADRPDVGLRVRAWPLELVNGAPLQAGAVAEEVTALRASVAPDLFGAFDPAAFPSSSLPAFGLAAAAYRRDAATGEAVALELRDRLFERGEDIGDPTVLARVAEAHDLAVDEDDVDQVRADHAEGRSRGVVGSPHFFTPAGDFFCPSLDIGRDDEGQLRVALDTDELDRFLRACFD
jgi:predicted DsbA family dithiol-disulfide isomerase